MNAINIAERNALVVADRRARMPQVAAWLDELRKTFENATVAWAIEGDYRYRESVGAAVAASDNTNYVDEKLRQRYRRTR